jgi:cell division protein ZipA
MDKEILRIVIIATGLVVVVGMLLWTFLKSRKSQQGFDFFNDGSFRRGGKSTAEYDDDDFDIVPIGSAKHAIDARKNPITDYEQDEALFDVDDEDFEPAPRFATPKIIQVSLVAKADEGFNGMDLLNAFELVGLEYGSLKIFERLDANRLVDFGVASMSGTGIFPDKSHDAFYTPGLVFFMQPAEVDDAQAVFDDYIQTIKLLATELDGEIQDDQRKPLTEGTIQLIRQSL